MEIVGRLSTKVGTVSGALLQANRQQRAVIPNSTELSENLNLVVGFKDVIPRLNWI
jgi:hypothetical protein